MNAIELTIEEEQRRTALVHKLTQGTISLTETQELRTLLERERHILIQQGNCLAFFAARFLVDYIAFHLCAQMFHFSVLDLDGCSIFMLCICRKLYYLERKLVFSFV